MKTTLIMLCILISSAFAQEQCPCFATGESGTNGLIDGIAFSAIAHTSTPTFASNSSTLDVSSTSTSVGQNFLTNIVSGFQVVPSADASSKVYYNEFNETLIPSTSSNNIGTVIGHATQIDDWGVGNLREAYPQSSIFNKHGNSHTSFAVGLNTAVNIMDNGTIDNAFGVDSWVTTAQYKGGHIGNAYGGRFVIWPSGGLPGASLDTTYGIYTQTANNPADSIGNAYGIYTVLNNGASSASAIGNFYGLYVDTPLLLNGGNVSAAHYYGLYINDPTWLQNVPGHNPDPWAIKIINGKNDLGPARTMVGDLQITGPGNNAANKAVCFKSDRSLGFCSTTIGVDGSCTCN